MNNLFNSIALLGIIATAVPVYAQETTEVSETETTAAATPAPLELGQIYQRETHGDWIIQCVSTATPVNDPCEMNQLLTDDGSNNVARVAVSAVNNPVESNLIAAIQMNAPLGTYLPAGIGISIDDGPVRTLPFFVCNQNGCITQANLTSEEVGIFKKGGSAKILLRAAAAPDQTVQATLSLTGFTAAFDALSE